MKPIRQLDYALINKIAAGEVVDRPLSVVKELTENAVDAGASVVTVEIREGGLEMIRITDNGSGIPAEELSLAFAQHATSKIADVEDLFEIMTMGFRGEALSSIAAVSQVEMITKTRDAVAGTRITVLGGTEIDRQAIGCADGTTIVVSNLFFNTPARRKFLKKPSTEAAAISDIMQKLALANPGLSIRYISNGQLMLQTNGNGDVKNILYQLYGREVATKLIALEAGEANLSLSGYVGKPETARGNRQYGHFFMNRRYIQSRLLQQAVEAAMKTMLPSGKFPVYALYLDIPPDRVDVNVHPAKLEVRFADENGVCAFVQKTMHNALADQNLIPTVSLTPKHDEPYEPYEPSLPDASLFDLPSSDVSLFEPPSSDASLFVPHSSDASLFEPPSSDVSLFDSPLFTSSHPPFMPSELDETALSFHEESRTASASASTVPAPALVSVSASAPASAPASVPASTSVPAPSSSPLSTSSSTSSSTPFFKDYCILGLLFKTYWLVAQGESLYLIDQHAAHERVLYEKIAASLQQGPIPAQHLLDPVCLRLTHGEMDRLRENTAFFNRAGFEFTEVHGMENGHYENTVEIRTVPFLFKGPVPPAFFTELLDKLGNVGVLGGSLTAHKINAVAMLACKAAVKANDALSETEARSLIQQMLTLENPFTCPHGRPTIIEITRHEIERKFKRVN